MKYNYFGRRKGHKLSFKKNQAFKNILPLVEIRPEDIKKTFGINSKLLGNNITLEIGYGSGDNLNYMLSRDEDAYFIGVEIYENGVAEFLSQLLKKNLKRVKVFRHDFRMLLDNTPSCFFNRILILYPDPWIKRRHNKRRIINHSSIKEITKVMKVGGLIYIATDVKEYFLFIIEVLSKEENLSILNNDNFQTRPKELGPTRYEKKARINLRDSFFLVAKKTSG